MTDKKYYGRRGEAGYKLVRIKLPDEVHRLLRIAAAREGRFGAAAQIEAMLIEAAKEMVE